MERGGGAVGEVLASWDVVRRLYAAGMLDGTYPFEALQIKPPPGPSEAAAEIAALHVHQLSLVNDRARQEEILSQADTSNLSDIFAPLGIESGGFDSTERMIELILQVAERVGYFYKAVFNRQRPNQVDSRLRPFIPVPPHAAFPSNHSFQMFCIAEVLTRLIPEHPGTTELFFVAERVAENREHAGLHYRSDTEAGQALARQFAPFFINLCSREMRQALLEWH
ncbi:hypothetical protein X772_35760 [Mesorhizobium sp. LSJC280B00]|nr:hypothetical protein X772_35760 [Mesorhizobium sp. LSJC280B00]